MPVPQGKLSYQELMRLKRGERPTPQDWERFDSQLRIKQRKLLQRQPVSGGVHEPEFWRRFRKSAFYCCATLSCGAIGWLSVSSRVDTNVVSEPAPAPDRADNPLSVSAAPVQPVVIARSAPEQVTEKFYEVAPVRAVATAAPEPVTEPAKQSIASKIASLPDLFSLSGHAEEAPHLLGKSVVDLSSLAAYASIDSNSDRTAAEDTERIISRYSHPLSSRGFSYAEPKRSSDTLDRLTSVALKANLLDEPARWGKKLELVSIRF